MGSTQPRFAVGPTAGGARSLRRALIGQKNACGPALFLFLRSPAQSAAPLVRRRYPSFPLRPSDSSCSGLASETFPTSLTSSRDPVRRLCLDGRVCNPLLLPYAPAGDHLSPPSSTISSVVARSPLSTKKDTSVYPSAPSPPVALVACIFRKPEASKLSIVPSVCRRISPIQPAVIFEPPPL
jgi:hypothetical protein